MQALWFFAPEGDLEIDSLYKRRRKQKRKDTKSNRARKAARPSL
jgi:hypothetical protein